MRLKQLYNEIKLVPSNRILLQRFNDDYYYFMIENEFFIVYRFELQYYKIVKFYDNLNLLKSFLNQRHIPYEIGNFKIFVGAKYFVVPDKLNEIKLVKQNNPFKFEIGDKVYDGDNWGVIEERGTYQMFENEINDDHSYSLLKPYKKENWYNIYYTYLDIYFWCPESKLHLER